MERFRCCRHLNGASTADPAHPLLSRSGTDPVAEAEPSPAGSGYDSGTWAFYAATSASAYCGARTKRSASPSFSDRVLSSGTTDTDADLSLSHTVLPVILGRELSSCTVDTIDVVSLAHAVPSESFSGVFSL